MLTGSISHWRKQLTTGAITPTELVQEVSRSIEERNPAINAYISWDKDAALAAAAKADLSLPLGGIPIAIKDNICIEGAPTRCASRILDTFRSPYDATAITRLRAAGAIPFGRANMDEFAMGSFGKNSAYGVTDNPAAPGHVPGGSSSGSAAAVAGGMAIAALGSDTGGSIRQPASHCGIVGLKPTYGRVSRYGLVAFASSLDQIGPLTQNVEDAALLLNALCGHDEKDSTSSTEPTTDFTAGLGQSIKGARIGLPKEYLSEGNDPAVSAAVQTAVQKLTELGAEIVEISLPHAEAVVAAYYIIACAEASSNLSRFDGIRYGHRAESTNGLDDLYSRSRAEGFGPEVKRRIILGTYVLSSGFYDAYYAKAQKVRALVAQDFSAAFEKVDFILGPVAPTPAPALEGSDMTPLQVYLADIYTIPANLAGLPGISIPCPQPEGARPVGVQLLGKHFAESELLRVASALES
ncbi:MAG: Asp-tRNA(Asn)/Glu-tRNA(Gln) amidotransferase subunit GatA, partial [Eggerthellaceae bacterium]|nr:Asp-tRNA(Asn)/Glu-tRNA(Gln) amidotransferase subunit GatA [Eggerthellaceae bacterium]